jgi:hypothetical protein
MSPTACSVLEHFTQDAVSYMRLSGKLPTEKGAN